MDYRKNDQYHICPAFSISSESGNFDKMSNSQEWIYDSIPHSECDSKISSNCYQLVPDRATGNYGNEIENIYSIASSDDEEEPFLTKFRSKLFAVFNVENFEKMLPRRFSLLEFLQFLIFNDLIELVIISSMLAVFAIIIFNVTVSTVY